MSIGRLLSRQRPVCQQMLEASEVDAQALQPLLLAPDAITAAAPE
jgi:hypothetical protein